MGFAQDSRADLISRINSDNLPRDRATALRQVPLPDTISLIKFPAPGIGVVPAQNDFSRVQRSQDVACRDSSFLKIFESADRSYSFFSSVKTKDGGIVLGGYGRNKLLGPPNLWYGVITKFDSVGNHIWSRELESLVLSGIYIETIYELADGSILATGEHINPLSTSPPNVNNDFFIAKLSSTGDLIWIRSYHSLIAGNCSNSNIRYMTLAEGANGELFFGATVPNCTVPSDLAVLKFSSTGDLLWNYTFIYPFFFCVGIFYDGDHITVVSRGPGPVNGSVRLYFLRLNSATGSYISHKTWIPDLPYPANFYAGLLNWTPQAKRLANGNYCIYGQTFGDYSIDPVDMPHFSVLEFNADYNYVRGYTIHSSLIVNLYQSKIETDRFGHVVFSMTDYADLMNRNKFYGFIENGIVVNQRKRLISNMEHFYDNLQVFDNGSGVYINNLATPGQSNFYLHYSLMHATDTGSQCLGFKENFSYTSPINYITDDFTWPVPIANSIINTNNQDNGVTPLVYTAPPPCYQIPFCDTLKIHGVGSVCNWQQDLDFTAFKNRECGSTVSWSLNPAVVQTFQALNDTTLRLRLNQPWQGWLYAGINTSCGLLKDSILLTIMDAPGAVDIGPDTTICPSNTILLNAHRGYAYYEWNDGTTDSLLIVNSPGTYYVNVSDACGNAFSDTVTVSPSPPIPFSIGPDRTKCNSDTLHLAAPGGFLNYVWGPSYNINLQNGQQVIVQPLVDTSYFVKGEKTPGCFAYDTIKVQVNTSPPINLGADKSFCQGDSAILNAGNGFSQYQWNTGPGSQQVVVQSAGNYSVIGTSPEGCQSFDTLRIINVWPNPQVTLNHNPGLCTGDTRVLNAGNFSSYVWQDGSNSSSFSVTGAGMYYVTVWDNNQCKGSDTVIINTLWPLPSQFLPDDTSICNYGSLVIKPNSAFSSYTWSNNSSFSSISVTLPGLYWLQVKDGNNCTGRDSILVKPRECLKGFYIPTAFTPDNNGRNDDFKPFIGGIVRQYHFTIYNRWGQVIFTTKDRNKGWDGTLGGTKQDTNVFTWMCTYQLEGEPVKSEKGIVVLIR
jgi:gliding motility-associated-like protein